MAICEAVELDRVVGGSGLLVGWTYEQVARDTMDYLAWGQMDDSYYDGSSSPHRGGWGYAGSDNGVMENPVHDRADNSNAGYVTLALGFAETPSPNGCGFTVPQFVKDELNLWIDHIQQDVDGLPDPGCDSTNTADCDGGSRYDGWDNTFPWVNILKTGNLLQQMAFVGDSASTGRVQDALDYMARHWDDADQDPGWRGNTLSSNYQATFTAMKGFTSLGIHEFGDPAIDWQTDFETVLLDEQQVDGSWPWCDWGDPLLCTAWALLTLQKVAPPPAVPFDIRPQSCPNPIYTDIKGVLPVAILGTDDLDVTQIDPATVRLSDVAPLRWSLRDKSTPFVPFVGKENCEDCNKLGPDGYLDLTLKFNSLEVVAALGDVNDGDCIVLTLTGSLKEEFGGTPIFGEDVVVILKKR
jgi:hypothetical protein